MFDADLLLKRQKSKKPETPKSPVIITPLQAAVARSMKLLDRIYPGWLHRISAERLDIRSSYKHCVLAQLYGGYQCGMDQLRSSEFFDENTWYAFGTTIRHPYTNPQITAEWKRQISARRSTFAAR